jgi:hypothetical protein
MMARTFPVLKGDALTRMAILWGLKRRWWGLEPDLLLRRRLNKLVTGYYK